jgi:molybdopterin adenylyltransferase
MTTRPAQLGLVSISDRASRGEYEDRSGPAMARYLDDVLVSPHELHSRLIPDEPATIEATLIDLADEAGCDLILTSGGTGPAPRDVTPEATARVCSRFLPGFGELMRRVSLREVPTAILSRQEAGIRGRCLIINLPGNPRAIKTCLDAVFAAIPDCVDLLGGARLETDPAKIEAYRPHD